MRSIWHAVGQFGQGKGSSSPSSSSRRSSAATLLPFDEDPRRRSSPTRRLRAPRLRRVTAWLLLIDLAIILFLVWLVQPLIVLLRRNEELFSPRVTLSNDTLAGLDEAGQRRIPRILHQTTATDDIPEKWVKSQQSCKDTYRDFEYKLWTDQRARDFLEQEYPWFVETWDSYDFPIQRADSIRYFVLHHYGGIYLDMDTICHAPFPLHQIDSGTMEHRALFESTLPTGITNDFMVSTARHPAFAGAIAKLPLFYSFTRFWARLEPYCAIMLSSGPLFLSLVVKDYLLELPSLPSATVQVIESARLRPYITDLESSTWHRKDTQALMWLGQRPWSWLLLGALGVVVGAYLVNLALLACFRAVRKVPAVSAGSKLAKLI